MKYSYSSIYRFNRENFEKSKQTNGYKAWKRAQYQAQAGHCAWCYSHTEYKDMDVDHISPVGRAGYDTNINDFDNLVLACRECNRDIKKSSAYNEYAYNNTLQKLSKQQKQDGYAPKKIYWKRPEWIGANKYSNTYHDYIPINIPEEERNVWLQEAPLIRNYSLKINEFDYTKSVIADKINDNSDTIWNFIKWAFIGGIILVLLFSFSQISNSNNSTSIKTKTCDYSCQESARMKYEAEEEKKRQKEKEEEYEEAKRYWECINAGGSDYDCG